MSADFESAHLPALAALAVAVLLASTAVPLTQSDGDLFAHVAWGRRLLASHALPGAGPVAPAWGSAVALAVLERAGGLRAVALATAALAAATHARLAHETARAGAAPRHVVLATAVGVALACTHWLARPHAASLAATAVLAVLLQRAGDVRPWAYGLLFLAWANLHGAWPFGLALLVAYTGGAWIASHRTPDASAPRTVGLLARGTLLAALATTVNPWGLALHRQVLATWRDPALATVVSEHRPPATDAGDLLFYGVLVAATALALSRRLRLTLPRLLVVLLAGAMALRAGRHVSLFAVSALPMLAWSTVPVTRTAPAARRPGRIARAAVACGLGAGLALVPLAGRAWPLAVDPARFPVRALAIARAHDLRGPLLAPWAWSGFIPYAWPGRAAWFDPLAFSPTILRRYGTMLLARNGWRHDLAQAGVATALLPPDAPLAHALAADADWHVLHADATAVLFRRAP